VLTFDMSAPASQILALFYGGRPLWHARWAALRQWWRRQPLSDEQRYLSQASSHADLERRQHALQRPELALLLDRRALR
jgi:hypothetical protein